MLLNCYTVCMDVRRLEVLRELRIRGSVAAVAIATHRTPSAVSQQLKQLQREAGVPLTERSGRGIALTPAGEALAESATGIAVAIEQADALWQTYLGTPAGEVDFATFPTGGEMFLPGLLTALAATPGLRLIATDVDPAHGDFASLTNDHDIVLGHSVGPNPRWQQSDIRAVHLLDEPLDIALAADHPLAAQESVTPQDLIGERWFGVPADYPFERVLQEIARVAGMPLDIVQRFSDTRVTEALVAAGQGVAVLPRFTSGTRSSGVVLRPLRRIAPTRRIAALLRPDRAERPSSRIVLAALRQIAAQLES